MHPLLKLESLLEASFENWLSFITTGACLGSHVVSLESPFIGFSSWVIRSTSGCYVNLDREAHPLAYSSKLLLYPLSTPIMLDLRCLEEIEVTCWVHLNENEYWESRRERFHVWLALITAVVGNFLRNLSTHQNNRVSIIKSQKSQRKYRIYVETRMGENHEERFHYSNGDYNDVLWCARVSGLNPSSSALKGIFYLYR